MPINVEEAIARAQLVADLNVGLNGLREVASPGVLDLNNLTPEMREGLFAASAAMVQKAKQLAQLDVGEYSPEMSQLVDIFQRIQVKFAPPSLMKSAVYSGGPSGPSVGELIELSIPPMKALVQAFPQGAYPTNEAGPVKLKFPGNAIFAQKPPATKLPGDSLNLAPPPVGGKAWDSFQTAPPPARDNTPPQPTEDCSLFAITRRGNAGTMVRVCELPPAAKEPLSGPAVFAPSPSALPWVVTILAAGGLGFYFKNRKKKAGT